MALDNLIKAFRNGSREAELEYRLDREAGISWDYVSGLAERHSHIAMRSSIRLYREKKQEILKKMEKIPHPSGSLERLFYATGYYLKM